LPYKARDPLQLAAKNLESGDADPRLAWIMIARPDQVVTNVKTRRIYFQGGRGSGKTRSSAQCLADWILADQEDSGEWGIVAPTYRDAWTTCVEGESGILAAFGTNIAQVKKGESKYIETAYRSNGEVTLRSGHLIRVDSANDGALRIQGKNLKGLWADEIGLWSKWEVAWDESIEYAVRMGRAQIVCSGTPKVSRPAAKLIRRMISDAEGTTVRRLRTIDNMSNLAPAFYDSVVARSKGTRLEQQELEGVLLDDVENSLWTRRIISDTAVQKVPGDGVMSKVLIGVDPSDGATTSDEQAYTVVGLSQVDRELYVLENFGERIGPVQFAHKVVQAAAKYHGTIIIERNHGGAWLEATFQQVMKDTGLSVPYMLVRASQAKRTRAEPVAALYERKKVHHVHPIIHDEDNRTYQDEGSLAELEDQMCQFTGADGEKSPDRLDSLVWAITPMLAENFGEAGRNRRPPREWGSKPKDQAEEKSRMQREISRKRGPNFDYVPDGAEETDAEWHPPAIPGSRRRNVREWDLTGASFDQI
jgi:phage terminase large subunit-like protein